MTATTPATIDDGTLTITRRVLVRADRDAVWAALTVPELLTEWFGEKASFEVLSAGGRGILGWTGYGDFPIRIEELQEPGVFAFRWGEVEAVTLTEDNSTVARFTLDEVPEGTQLTVVETGFDRLAGDEASRRARAEGNREGWDDELDELVAFLEKQDSV